MGEIADAMLDGTLCAGCGTYIGEDAGFPVYCSEACTPDDLRHCTLTRKERHAARQADRQSSLPRFNRYSIPPREGTVDCPYCATHPKLNGLADHIRAKHPEKVKGEQP